MAHPINISTVYLVGRTWHILLIALLYSHIMAHPINTSTVSGDQGNPINTATV